MLRKSNQLRSVLLLGLNLGIIGYLLLTAAVVVTGGQSWGSGEQLVIPDDSLVYEASLTDITVTKAQDQIRVDLQGKATVYLMKTETEVLSSSAVALEVPAFALKKNLTEVSSGKYSVALAENLLVTPQVEGVSALQIDEWKIQPLECSVSVNSRTESQSLNMPAIRISTLQSGMEAALKARVLETKVADYIPNAGVVAIQTTPQTYQISIGTTIKAKVLDIDGFPIANRNLSITLELPDYAFSEAVSVTTDSQGVFSYARTETILVTVSGGQITTLGAPLQIENTSFPVMILQWGGGGGGGGGGRDPKDNIPTSEGGNMGQPPTGDNAAGADPINITTGNMYHMHQDLHIPGRGLSIDLTRTYNSRDTYEGPFGYGWTHSYNIFLREESGGNVRERDEDGTAIVFTRRPDGSYTPPAGNHDNLTKNADGTYRVRRKHGTIYDFNMNGKLIRIVDINGNQVTLTYTGNNLTTITDTGGRQIALAYDSNGRVVRLTDHMGRPTTYSYDGSNDLVSVADPLGNTTQYSYQEEDYDEAHNLTEITDARGYKSFITYDDKHRATSFSYEANNHKVTLSYDPDNNKTTVTDSKGNQTVYYYTIISDVRMVTRIVDPTSHTQLSSWDSDLNKISSTNQNGNTTTMVYDSAGNLTSITDLLGSMTSFTYEPTYNKVTRITDPLGSATVYVYDNRGNLVEVTDAGGNTTAYAYDASGSMTSSTDANGDTTTYAYDDTYGNLVLITNALANQTAFAYDLIGNCTQTTNAVGGTTSFLYDQLNRLTRITNIDSTTVSYTYDQMGNRTSITDPKGNTTTYEYDPVNRLANVLDPLGGQTNYAYDTEGNRIGITNASRNTTRYIYDSLNRLTEVINPLQVRTLFSYDPAGNRISKTDGNGRTINYSYDACNRLIQITYPDSSAVGFIYDAAGKRVAMTDGQGTTHYAYDELNHLVQVDGPESQETITYTYESVGNRITMVDQDGGTTTYAYDAVNRLVSLTNPKGEITTYAYDSTGNLTRMDYPNNTQTTYGYDPMNRLVNLVNRRTAVPKKQQEIISSYAYQYDLAGMRTRVALEDGDYILYGYDKLNRLTQEIKRRGDSGRTFYIYSYAYDPVGNRTNMTRGLYERMTSAGGGAADSGGVASRVVMEDLPGISYFAYTYDQENRLLGTKITLGARVSAPPAKSRKAPGFKSDEILVKFKAGTSEQTINTINAKYRTSIVRKIPKLGVLKLKVASAAYPPNVVAAYKNEPTVEYAELNYLVHTVLTPNDPSFNQQWGLNNTGQTGGIPDSDIDAPEAWDLELGDPAVVIAVVDTGVDLDHPDLAGRVLLGHDFINDDDEAEDDHGHGTSMAGIAAALTDNGVGIAGICWYAQILPVKVLDSSGTGTHADVADGIIYAADNGAHVINLSIGDPASSTTLENAVKYAYDLGIVLVAGVGNDNGPVLYPAAYDGYVLAVAATDKSDQRARWSNYGPEVDVAAPGVDIYTTRWNDTYTTISGTSASAPFASGVAALILSQSPGLTPAQVMDRIKSTCDDVNPAYPGEDDYLGAGRINAYAALTAATPTDEQKASATIEYAYDNNGNQIRKTISNAKGNPSNFNYAYDYENRLTTITYPDGKKSRYTYNGGGKRILTDEEGQITKYLYDGLTAIIERSTDGATHTYYTRGIGYGGGIGSLISVQQGPDSSYYHYDGIGTVTEMTDSAAKTAKSYTYDAFGNILTQNGLVQDPYSFSTKEYSAQSGLVYFGARWYDPGIGRFITEDFLAGNIYRPSSLHRYVYVQNNPVNWIDPLGLCAEKTEREVIESAIQEAKEVLSRRKIQAKTGQSDESLGLAPLGSALYGVDPQAKDRQDAYLVTEWERTQGLWLALQRIHYISELLSEKDPIERWKIKGEMEAEREEHYISWLERRLKELQRER